MTCSYCKRLNEDEIRAAFRTRKPLYLERVEMVTQWHDEVSPNGLPSAAAAFFCDACGQTFDVVIELKGEPDPADWWKV